MEQIRKYLENHNTASSLKLLEEEQEAIQKQMLKLQKVQKNVAHRLNTIRSAQNLPCTRSHRQLYHPVSATFCQKVIRRQKKWISLLND